MEFKLGFLPVSRHAEATRSPRLALGPPVCAFALVTFVGAMEAQGGLAAASPEIKPATAHGLSAARGKTDKPPDRRMVRQAQWALKYKGLDPGLTDGFIGPRTQSSLRSYQQAEGLAVTGRLDPETEARLGIQERLVPSTRGYVRELQRALVETGHDPGPIDGILGPRTRAALRSYLAAPPPRTPTVTRESTEWSRRARDRS